MIANTVEILSNKLISFVHLLIQLLLLLSDMTSYYPYSNGFGGLVVCMLASRTQDRGFAPGRIRRIFRSKKSSACLPSEGK
jgi:hypothetical protein